jgi:hypothetical protein
MELKKSNCLLSTKNSPHRQSHIQTKWKNGENDIPSKQNLKARGLIEADFNSKLERIKDVNTY